MTTALSYEGKYSVTLVAEKHEMWTFLDLRKQARQLENEIDLKLVAFSKLGAGINTPHSSHSDTVPLLSGEDTFEAMSMEIEQLLNKVY